MSPFDVRDRNRELVDVRRQMNVGVTVADPRRDTHQSHDHLVVIRLARFGAKARHLGGELLARDRVKGVLVPLRKLAREEVDVGAPLLGIHRRQGLRLRVRESGERHGQKEQEQDDGSIHHDVRNASSWKEFRCAGSVMTHVGWETMTASAPRAAT